MDRLDDKCIAFEGGSFRENSLGKGLYSVIPPIAMTRVSQRYELGMVKYGKSDAFKDGMPTSRSFDSAMRHLWGYLAGDNSEDHLAAAVWNMFAIMEMEVNNPKWQDLPSRKKFRKQCKEYLGYTRGEY